MSKPSIFIGSSSEAINQGNDLVAGLRAELGDSADIHFWNEPALMKTGSLLFQRLTDIAESTDFAVLLLTPTERFAGEAAPNVLYELGLFMGHLERYRTMIIVEDGIDPPSDIDGLLHLKAGDDDVVAEIADRVRAMGQRVNPEIELAALARMLNVCTPAHPDYDAPHLTKVKKLKDESFASASDFFELTHCLLRRYVIGSIEPQAIRHLRIYFAIYLGDGIAHQIAKENTVQVRRFLELQEADRQQATQKFVIALSNPRPMEDSPVVEERLGTALQNDWLLGQPIPGYTFDDFKRPQSTCAKAFATQFEVEGSPGDEWNLPTDSEAEVLAVPVVWKQQPHTASIGVLAISSDRPDIEEHHKDVIQRLRMVANVLGVAADRLSQKIEPDRSPIVGIDIDEAADSRSFARRAVEMRRSIGEFALDRLVERNSIHVRRDEDGEFVAVRGPAATGSVESA